ncbi:MAG: shikimate dehydrogenase [Thermosediminibacterales bacterium]|jgi:shikimate dehydrogenase|nr:shikimate dehydrogenase [Thermosediminibacterales bacterium]
MNHNIMGTTKVVGIIGWPVEHSLSPVMHNNAFSYLGLDYCYVPFPVKPDYLHQAVNGIRALSIKGVNVTVPYKERILPLIDELSNEAAQIGAVNTILNENGRLKGYNTDGLGFYKALKAAGINPKDRRAILIGAGGAARAIGIYLALKGVGGIILTNRSQEKAGYLKNEINKISPGICEIIPFNENSIKKVLQKGDLLVNTTPLGMSPKIEDSPIKSADFFREDIVVFDIVYNPLETMFLKMAKQAGCCVIYGDEMLLYQGAAAFEIWTGKEAPVEIMRKFLKSNLGNYTKST